MLNILKDFDYLEQYEYLKNRSFADELLFVAKEVDKRFFAKLTDEQKTQITNKNWTVVL